MDIVANFDPSVQPIPNVNAQVPANGKIVFYNESSRGLELTFSDGTNDILAPWTAQVYCLGGIPSPDIKVQQLYSLSSTDDPESKVIAIRYMPSEKVHGTYPIALARQTNVGNTVNTNTMTSSTTNVTNDGNPANTIFIEATQSGNSSGSNVAIGNDGSFTFAQFISNVLTQYFKGVPGANPLIEVGAKALFQMADNAGILGTILKIDASGNTILQEHPTAQDFQITDKNGNTLIEVDSTGHFIINNNQSMRGRDTGGTPQALFKYDTSNNVLLVTGTSRQLQIQDNISNNNFVIFDGLNQTINVAGTVQTVNGDTSGDMTVQEIFAGGSKWVIVKQDNYRQAAATPQQLVLKNTFTGPFGILNLGCGGMQILNGASVQSGNYCATIAATGGTFTAETTSQQMTVGWNNTAIDRVQSQGSYANAHTGVFILMGY